MNIFVIDSNTKICAQALDNLRLNKMIVETAQLLSTAIRFHGYSENNIYKSTHKNHPCNIWARETNANYIWLLQYMQDLVSERQSRTGKSHKSYEIFNTLTQGQSLIPKGSLTPWQNCTPHKDLNTFDAYKLTLKNKWINDKRSPTWTNSHKPSWAERI